MTHDTINPSGPLALMYAGMGAFIGALIRPPGSMIADKTGGALVTQIISFISLGSAPGVAYCLNPAHKPATSEEYFIPFSLLFLTLFAAKVSATTGIGNSSTFCTVFQVLNQAQAGPVLGWNSAVAAYGAFYIPKVFGERIKATRPENALYGFTAFYAVCIVVNWCFYLRKGAEFHNPYVQSLID